MKLWHAFLILFSAFISLECAAYDMTCISLWEDHSRSKARLGVPPRHRPQIFWNPSVPAKEAVIVFSHGIFESPRFFEGVAEKLADQGYLVLSLLLPGHWEGSPKSLDSVHFSDWVKEVKMNVDIADCFSKKIILAGHSLGGLLAVNMALSDPSRFSGLLLWSPALRLKPLPLFAGIAGSVLKLNGNMFIRRPVNLDETPYYSPNAPVQIQGLISSMARAHSSKKGFYQKINIPTMVIYTEDDPAVSPLEIAKFYDQISGKKQNLYYPKNSFVWHGNIAKSAWDAYREYPKDYNHFFDQMMRDAISFFEKQNL